VLEHFGYTQYALGQVKGILSDNMSPTFVMRGDVVTVPALQPSGKYGTAEDNSLRGLTMLVYAWIYIKKANGFPSDVRSDQFFQYVLPVIYGDDLLAAVKDRVAGNFNNIVYQEICDKLYGIGYTDANKTGSIRKFLQWHEVSFLKRTFVYREDLGHWTAPLSLDSVMKSIVYYLPSKNISVEDQMLSSCISALRELFFHHHEEDYNTLREDFAHTFEAEYGLPYAGVLAHFPTFSTIQKSIYPEDEARIIGESKHEPLRTLIRQHRESRSNESPRKAKTKAGHNFMDNTTNNKTNKNPSPQTVTPVKFKRGYSPMSVPRDPNTGTPAIDQYSLEQLKERPHLGNSGNFTEQYWWRVVALGLIEVTTYTGELVDKRKKRRKIRREVALEQGGRLVPESAPGMMGDGSVTPDTIQNLTEVSGETAQRQVTAVSPDDMRDGSATSHHLDDFFERPVSLYDSRISVVSLNEVRLKLWYLWATNPAVMAKLRNYAYFKGEMHIRVSITATPFHYGTVLLSYQAMKAHNDNISSYDLMRIATTPGNNIIPLWRTYLSQSPTKAYISPSDNQPVEMTIPFVYFLPKLGIGAYRTTVVDATTGFENFKDMGELHMLPINPLMVANDDAESDISVNVYGWMTNVELGNITATDMVIPESQEPGPLETVATAVESITRGAEDMPIIGGLMSTTTKIAHTIGSAASIFGFARPPLLKDQETVKNTVYAGGANTSGKEVVMSLTTDPKRELSMAMDLGGTVGDCMDIKYLSRIETFLTTFTWSGDDVANDTSLWKCGVSPYTDKRHFFQTGGLNRSIFQPTAMSFAARPFRYWRGTIRYRFEVACSAFHRGKLLVRYDPNVSQHVLIRANGSTMNEQNTFIVDIQDTRDFTIEVSWAHPKMWATNANANTHDTPDSISPTSNVDFASFSADSVNGFLEVRPLNDLIQPTATSSVPINVYVSCHDLEVYSPSQTNIEIDHNIYWESDCDHNAHLVDQVIHTINPNNSRATDAMHLLHFGERIVSFRSLLKRYTTYYTTSVQLTDSSHAVRLDVANFPVQIDPDGNSGTWTTLFMYMRLGYLGVRGSMRQRVTQSTPTKHEVYTRSTLTPPSTVNVFSDIIASKPSLSSLTNVYLANRSILDGTALMLNEIDGGHVVEAPFITNNLFLVSFSPTYARSFPPVGYESTFGDSVTHDLMVDASNDVPALVVMSVTVDMATGEDFTFLRFSGAPLRSSSQ
jgi:hypothetical protein